VVGVAVLDQDGREVFAARPDDLLLPASTEKLVPAAAALRLLGPQHRFTTTVLATAPVGPDGTLSGDLVLVGGGDPVLATPTFATQAEPDRPHTPLAVLADQVVAAGVRRVSGEVLGDSSAFADEPLPAGWRPEYLDLLEGVRTSALTVDAGRRLGIRDGRLISDPEPDPPTLAAAHLRTLLIERGVAVDGGPRGTRTPPPGVAELGRVESPALAELLTYLLQHSDNQMADQVFRSVGAATGDGTWTGSAAAARAALADLGVDAEGVVLADGSGLSRDDRVSARFLAQLDLAMTGQAAADWEPVQALAGHSGTLRHRLRGTPAEGRLRGKTGSLEDVRALAGAVVGPNGTRHHFAVIGNGLDDPAAAAVRDLADQVVLALAEQLYGCQRTELLPPPPEDPADPPPPPIVQWQCAA
jgi:D-alanyl-D-alanine carboxypeptidase/D-alanyl-D-alanine-endopeptidase (penicillin-binding protein 4)